MLTEATPAANFPTSLKTGGTNAGIPGFEFPGVTKTLKRDVDFPLLLVFPSGLLLPLIFVKIDNIHGNSHCLQFVARALMVFF